VGLGLGAVAAVGATAAFVVDQQHKKQEAEAAQARAVADAAKAQAEVDAASPRLHALFEDLKNFETQFTTDSDKGKYSNQIDQMKQYNTRLKNLSEKLADEIKNTKDPIQSQQELRNLMNEVSNYLRANVLEFEPQDPRVEKFKALLANIGYYGSLGLFSIGGRFAVKALFDVFGLPGSWVPESLMMYFLLRTVGQPSLDRWNKRSRG
jgi:vacuolar-type H+-ATPase subunit I/STV1